MYRPPNWDEIRRKIIAETLQRDMVEATADAILEALKKGIKPTLKAGRIGDAVVGYLVFIPEEK